MDWNWSTILMMVLLIGAVGIFIIIPMFSPPITLNQKVLALFYSDSCPHCQVLKPTWQRLSENFNGTNGCSIVAISADNTDLMDKHGVDAFPTIKFLPYGLDNATQAVEYTGDRSFDDLVGFFKKVTL